MNWERCLFGSIVFLSQSWDAVVAVVVHDFLSAEYFRLNSTVDGNFLSVNVEIINNIVDFLKRKPKYNVMQSLSEVEVVSSRGRHIQKNSVVDCCSIPDRGFYRSGWRAAEEVIGCSNSSNSKPRLSFGGSLRAYRISYNDAGWK